MSVIDAIGGTPLVEIERINPWAGETRIMAKLEGANPCGSVKDRVAAKMIEMGLASKSLTRDKTVLEATSGNTGIGLAMVCASMGIALELCMPECVSLERRNALQALGARIVLTPPGESTDGAIRKAHELMESSPDRYFMPNQFDNPYNFMAHYETTGPEIWDELGGEITAFAAGMGTTGTLMGVSRFLKEKSESVKIVGVEPVPGHHIQGLKNLGESICPGIYQPDRVDEIVKVGDGDAFEHARKLAQEEGLFVGMSSGAAIWGAIEIAGDLPKGSTVVTILPDRGDRYLSTHLFASFCAKCPP